MPEFRACGGLTHVLRWQLDNSEKRGIIIQMICTERVVSPCNNKKKIDCEQSPPVINKRACDSNCYFEFWRVGRLVDGVIEAAREKKISTDTFYFPSCKNSRGFTKQSGAALFVPWDWIEANGLVDDISPPNFGTGDQGVSNAGILHSACFEDAVPKALWLKILDTFGTDFSKFTKRSAHTAWDCCETNTGECWRETVHSNPGDTIEDVRWCRFSGQSICLFCS